MLKAIDVARYFISKDTDGKLFNKKIVQYNSRNCYEGNIKLNKYLFLAQVVYLARYGCKLFSDDFKAYDNGPVIESIMSSYSYIVDTNEEIIFDSDIQYFLDQIYYSLENASVEELIEISHEDPEWKKLSKDTYNAPIMNIEKNIDIYRKRYKGLIQALKL